MAGIDDVFGADPDAIRKQQEVQRQKGLQDLLATLARKNQSVTETAGMTFGANLGSALGAGLVNRFVPDPAIEKQKKIQAGLADVDTTFQEDPAATPAENSAARYEAYRDAVGQHLSPKARLMLSAKIAAYRNDAFNQHRLTAADTIAAQKAKDDAARAKVDLEKSQIDLEQAQKVQKYGTVANLGVFKTPSGETIRLGQGSPEFMAMLDAANDPQAGVTWMGYDADIRKQEAAAALKTAGAKAYKWKSNELQKFDDLNQATQALNTLESELPGLQRMGGWTNLVDRAQETIASGKTMPALAIKTITDISHALFGTPEITGNTPSTRANTAANNMRLARQSLIKGVPSNNDQYIADASNVMAGVSFEQNLERLALLGADTDARLRAAYADAKEKVEESGKGAVPLALTRALLSRGIDPNKVGTAQDEMDQLNQLQTKVKVWNEQVYGANGQEYKPGEPLKNGSAPAPAAAAAPAADSGVTFDLGGGKKAVIR